MVSITDSFKISEFIEISMNKDEVFKLIEIHFGKIRYNSHHDLLFFYKIEDSSLPFLTVDLDSDEFWFDEDGRIFPLSDFSRILNLLHFV